MADYIPFSAEDVPVKGLIDIDGSGTEYEYKIEYNDKYDFYRLEVRDKQGALRYSTRLVYGGDALHAAHTLIDVVKAVIPKDQAGEHSVCNQATFGGEVRLYVEDQGA
jgi:hypothetical protein